LVEEAHAPTIARERTAWSASSPVAQPIPND
jgi:hypothetical protein